MYVCENQNGFVLYSSINHSRISVFTYSAKYQIIVYITQVASVIQPYIVLILTVVLKISG